MVCSAPGDQRVGLQTEARILLSRDTRFQCQKGQRGQVRTLRLGSHPLSSHSVACTVVPSGRQERLLEMMTEWL